MNDFFNLPVRPALDAAGAPVKVEVALAGERTAMQVWRVEVGRVPLYLLDTNLPENAPADPHHHRPALRRRSGEADPAGDRAGDRGMRALRRPRPRPRGLPHERRPLGLPVPGADPRVHGRARRVLRGGPAGRARGQRLHHPHPGARRLRRLLARRSWTATSATTSRSPGSRAATSWPWAAPTRTTSTSRFNMAALALRNVRLRQRRERAPRAGVAAAPAPPRSGGAGGRAADRPRHERHPHLERGLARDGRPVRPLPGARLVASARTRPRPGTASTASPTRSSGARTSGGASGSSPSPASA